MTDLFDRIRCALTSRYRIERELGSGGMAIAGGPADRRAVGITKPCLTRRAPEHRPRIYVATIRSSQMIASPPSQWCLVLAVVISRL
jgi:hypothetical protein